MIITKKFNIHIIREEHVLTVFALPLLAKVVHTASISYFDDDDFYA